MARAVLIGSVMPNLSASTPCALLAAMLAPLGVTVTPDGDKFVATVTADHRETRGVGPTDRIAAMRLVDRLRSLADAIDIVCDEHDRRTAEASS